MIFNVALHNDDLFSFLALYGHILIFAPLYFNLLDFFFNLLRILYRLCEYLHVSS